MKKFNIPILFMVFNRPDTTKQVFQKIREIEPLKLYVAADGPRINIPSDKVKGELVHKISTSVDWECNLKTLFQSENLGCGIGPITAIDWFFSHEEYGIILEDDCLPNNSFFLYCKELLMKYKNDMRIMHINGNNFGAKPRDFSKTDYYSYHFSNIPQVWGWATWKRAWEKFNWELNDLDTLFSSNYLNSIYKSKYKKIQSKRWETVRNGKQDIWDYQWQYSVISNHGLVITPKTNLISNIGFGENATHTKSINNWKSNLDKKEIEFPMKHPKIFVPNKKVNLWFQTKMLRRKNIYKTINNFINKFRK